MSRDRSNILDALLSAMKDGEDADSPPMTKDDAVKHAAALRNAYRTISMNEQFKEGDLVVWKEGMSNKNYPVYGEPIIITKVLKEPILDTEEKKSAYWREPLNIVCAVLFNKNGETPFVEYHYDSRRFKKYVSK